MSRAMSAGRSASPTTAALKNMPPAMPSETQAERCQSTMAEKRLLMRAWGGGFAPPAGLDDRSGQHGPGSGGHEAAQGRGRPAAGQGGGQVAGQVQEAVVNEPLIEKNGALKRPGSVVGDNGHGGVVAGRGHDAGQGRVQAFVDLLDGLPQFGVARVGRVAVAPEEMLHPVGFHEDGTEIIKGAGGPSATG